MNGLVATTNDGRWREKMTAYSKNAVERSVQQQQGYPWIKKKKKG